MGKTKQIGSLLIVFALAWACLGRGQRYSDFITRTPLPQGDYLILGIVGGREPWSNDKLWVRKLALELRAREIPHVQIETLENTKRPLALELIRNALDRNADGRLSAGERESARIIIYGLSFGGAAVVKLSWQLQAMEIPILLTVQVDSVGLGDAVIPPNVRRAANFYQPNGWFIKGEPEIRAANPTRTKILGNFKYDYRKKDVDLSRVHWFKKLFRLAHAKMSHDPDVWAEVKTLILNAIETRAGGAVGGVPSRKPSAQSRLADAAWFGSHSTSSTPSTRHAQRLQTNNASLSRFK